MGRLQELAFRLDEVARLYTRRFEQRAQTLSLRLAEGKALVVLAENEGVSQTRLSQISEIDPARLVRILDRLEAGGWAQRRPRPADRRMRSLAGRKARNPSSSSYGTSSATQTAKPCRACRSRRSGRW